MSLTKDIWQVIIGFIDRPKDFLSISLICKASASACRTYNVRDTKAFQFSTNERKYKDGKIYQEYFYLAYNKSVILHGPYATYEWLDDACITTTKRFHLGTLVRE